MLTSREARDRLKAALAHGGPESIRLIAEALLKALDREDEERRKITADFDRESKALWAHERRLNRR